MQQAGQCELCYSWHLTTVVWSQSDLGQRSRSVVHICHGSSKTQRAFLVQLLVGDHKVQSSQLAVSWSQAFVEVMVVCFGFGLTVNIACANQVDQPLFDCICMLYLMLTQYPYDTGTLSGSADQCILGNVYLTSNLSNEPG